MRRVGVQVILVAAIMLLALPIWWLELLVAAVVAVLLAVGLRRGRVASSAVVPLAALSAAGVVLAGLSAFVTTRTVVEWDRYGRVVPCDVSDVC